MFTDTFFAVVIVLYMAVLFMVAFWGDRRAESGRSLLRFSIIYALSIAVYCTDWTFYGSVGSAVSGGPGFLPVYLGPTLVAPLWWFILRKEIRIAKTYKITSLSDFVSARYSKSAVVGGVVAGFMVLGMLPYISLQLKGISTSFNILTHRPENLDLAFYADTAFYAAAFLAVFVIVFGTRNLDASERHEGMVLTIAFESVIKLFAFLLLGFYVLFVLYDGPSELIRAASEVPSLVDKLTLQSSPSTWFTVLLLSASAIMFLPHTFQTTVLENVDVRHVKTAMWGFPLYLFLINLFVMPIAFAGAVLFAGEGINTDTYVLNLPRSGGSEWLTLLVFLGGLSAGSGMVIVATIALAAMVGNNIVMPLLLRYKGREMSQQEDLTGLILGVRRVLIVLIILLAYLYFKHVSRHFTLISTGLTSFTAVAQLAPIILGGLFWKGANRTGALLGLTVGIGLWAYTLIFPMSVGAGIFPDSIMTEGLFGLSFLRPTALFGLEGVDIIPHGAFWSLSFNTLFFIFGSSLSQTSDLGRRQAAAFVDIFRVQQAVLTKRRANLKELAAILTRFVGKDKSAALIPEASAGGSGLEVGGANAGEFADGEAAELTAASLDGPEYADADLVERAETLLAGTIGAASARALIKTVVRDESMGINEVMSILDESLQIKQYSSELEKASKSMEAESVQNRRLLEDTQRDKMAVWQELDAVASLYNRPLVAMSKAGHIVYANRAGRRLLGDTVVGRPAGQVLGEKDGEGRLEFETVFKNKTRTWAFVAHAGKAPKGGPTEVAARYTFAAMFHECPRMLTVVETAKRAAEHEMPVLLLGESGTGKELFAQSIHNHSVRSSGPFIAVNCSAIPDSLIESELFGYVGGAFTGASSKGNPGKFRAANGGTIFLDEIGDMDSRAQAAILRVLQEGRVTPVGAAVVEDVNVRVVAATHRDLWADVQSGKFRHDLYFRLKGIVLELPPLRERTDIVGLAESILRQLSPVETSLSQSAVAAILQYNWPGNVRELRSVLQQALFHSVGMEITSEHFKLNIDSEQDASIYEAQEPGAARQSAHNSGLNFSQDTDLSPGGNWESRAIEKALRSARGNVSQAAKLLGMSRATLYRKLKKYGLS